MVGQVSTGSFYKGVWNIHFKILADQWRDFLPCKLNAGCDSIGTHSPKWFDFLRPSMPGQELRIAYRPTVSTLWCSKPPKLQNSLEWKQGTTLLWMPVQRYVITRLDNHWLSDVCCDRVDMWRDDCRQPFERDRWRDSTWRIAFRRLTQWCRVFLPFVACIAGLRS